MTEQKSIKNEQSQKDGIRYLQMPYSLLLKEEPLQKENKADIVLALLGDRMRLSRTKGRKFYDEAEQDYFVRFSQTMMSEYIHVSPRKVFSIYKVLDDNKYIWRKHVGYNRADNIFLTRYAQRLLPGLAEITKSDSQNRPPSNSKGNHREVSHRGSGSNDSVNSEHENKKSSSQNKNQDNKKTASHESTATDNENESSSKDKLSLNDRLQNWQDKVHQAVGLSTNVLTNILKATGMNTNLSGIVINWVKNARTNVTNKNHIPFRSKKAQFETNQNFDGPLADKIKHIANAMQKKDLNIIDAMRQGKEHLHACGRYVTTCLKEFFYDALGLRFSDKVRPKMSDDNSSYNNSGDIDYGQDFGNQGYPTINGPRIPIFRIR